MTASLLAVRDLRVRRISKAGSFELFVDALDVRADEVLTVLGPNGAGQSTLLRVLAGLLPAESGTVEKAGDATVTMVFQRPIPFAGTVEHNLRLALLGLRLEPAGVRARVDEGLAHFGISHLAKHRAHTLSGGELRRLALARAFSLRPSVLLLDEPFDDLDNDAREVLSSDLRRVFSTTGVGVVVVTHDLHRALMLADRIAVLTDGRVTQVGARDEMLARPRTIDVARQVGMANLLPARICGASGPAPRAANAGFAEVAPGGRLPVSGDWSPGTPVWLGIRPEHLEQDEDGAGFPLGKAFVRAVVSDGVARYVTLDWNGLELRMHLLAGRLGESTLSVGDPVALRVHEAGVHVMPREE